jgi:hypothetical protein
MFQIPSTFGEHRISNLLKEVNKEISSKAVSIQEISSKMGPVEKIPSTPDSSQEISAQAQRAFMVTFQFRGHS